MTQPTRVALITSLPAPPEPTPDGIIGVDLGRKLLRLELGDPAPDAPRCVSCHTPASVEAGAIAVCRACLVDAVVLWCER